MSTEKQRKILAALGGILAIVFIAWGLVITFGVLDDPPGRVRTGNVADTISSPDRQVDVVIDENAELDENLDRFVGKTAQVRGAIIESASPDVRTFALDTDGTLGNDEILLVRRGDAWKARLDDGTVIQAVGEVRRLDATYLRELNESMSLDLTEEQISGFDQKLLLIADEITIPAH